MTSLVKDNDTFIRLVRVAQEDPDTRRRLVTILSMDKSQRDPAIRTCLDEMKLQQKPQDFISAVACLLDEDVTNATLRLLREALEEDSKSADSIGKRRMTTIKYVASTLATAVLFGCLALLGYSGLLSLGLLPYALDMLFAFAGFGIGAVVGAMVFTKPSWSFVAGLATLDAVLVVVVSQLQ